MIIDPTLFRSGRHLAAWLGLVPRQHSAILVRGETYRAPTIATAAA